MTNYIKVFTGNFIEVQRVYNELVKLNICAIIKSESGRLAGFGSSIQGFQEVHVHKDEYDKTVILMEKLTSELQD